MMIEWEEKPLIILPRSENGIDWSKKRKLVLQDGMKQLFWVPGSTGWAGLGMQAYHESSLQFRDPSDRGGWVGTRIADGGRLLTHLRSDLVLRKISDKFSCEVGQLPKFKQGKTYVRKTS